MDWKYLFGLILLNSITFSLARQFNLRVQTRRDSDEDDRIENNEEQQQDSNNENENDDIEENMETYDGVLAMGDSGEKSEDIPPGQTLIRPDKTMLQSSATYPKETLQNSLVYGGSDSINRRPTDLLNTGFRRNNRNLEEALNVILDAVKRIDHDERNTRFSDYMMYLQRRPSNTLFNTRRSKSTSSDDSSSTSTEQEENIGNPYTIYKNKYKQNWPWNFEMDGDHMNLNPNGPEFTTSWGPSGSDLFYARKWWYFNQDDFVPFR